MLARQLKQRRPVAAAVGAIAVVAEGDGVAERHDRAGGPLGRAGVVAVNRAAGAAAAAAAASAGAADSAGAGDSARGRAAAGAAGPTPAAARGAAGRATAGVAVAA